MNTKKIKLSELKRPERNVRMHADKQIKEFKRSVEMFGQIRPIVVDEDNVILCGNGLYESLLALSWEEADCLVMKNLSEKDKKKLMLADNRIFNLGVDDISAFDDFIKELEDDLDIPGYDEEFLQSLVKDADETSDILSNYGKLDEDDIERINSAKRTEEPSMEYEQAETLPRQETAVATSECSAQSDREESNEVRKSVKCPHCGELIWL